MQHPFSHTPLGRISALPVHYAPELLAAVPRAMGRSALPVPTPTFVGDDVWQLYEISWLDARGVPQVAEGRLIVPFDSPAVCESKSLKLYLLSLNEETFATPDACAERIVADVSHCVGATVAFSWGTLPRGEETAHSVCLEAHLGDAPLARCSVEQARQQLQSQSTAPRRQRLHTDVFRSLCPVTGQPDWASIFIYAEGAPIAPRPLLTYLLSYRQHGAMHEQCIEQIFCDVMMACQPTFLCIDARFLRRGGIDINPLRASAPCAPLAPRLSRQ